MNAEEQQREVEELELRIERLRALYDQYFMGIEKIEPQVQRKDVERRIWLLRKEQIRNTGVRFKFQTVIQRYNTFQQYWQRTVREIENGTFKRDVLRAAKRFGAKEALTLLGKKKAAQYAALAEQQEKDLAKRKKAANAIDEDEIEALEDYDAEVEDFEEDDAPTPPSRRVDLPPDAGSHGGRAAAASAYATRMELDFGPTPGADPDYGDLDADTGRISAIPQSAPSRTVAESSPTPASPASPRAPLRGWPLVPPAAGSAGTRAPSGAFPRPSRPDLAAAPSDPEAARRRLAELAAQARRPVGGPPGESGPARLDLEVGAAPPPRAPSPLSAPTPYSPRGPALPLPVPAPPPGARPVQQARPPATGPRLPSPPSVPPPASAQVAGPPPASGPGATRPTAAAGPDAPSSGRPLVSAARPVQAFAGLANRALGPRPSAPGVEPVSSAPASAPDTAQRAAVARDAAAAARDAASSRAAARDEGALDEQRMRQVYSKYMEAKRLTNEPVAGVTFERLAQSLKAQEAKLKATHSGKRVDFEVVVKDGKATLKPIVR